jgi:hypothetical protein
VINEAIKQLSEGSLAHLVSSSPMTLSTTVNHNMNQPISPSNNHTQEALTIIPKTTNEIVLLNTLQCGSGSKGSEVVWLCLVISVDSMFSFS